MYGSAGLFRRMWPKLLHASAAEALGEVSPSARYSAPAPDAIRRALTESDQGRAAAPKTNGALSITKKESEKALLYETAERGATVHKSYVAK